MQILEEWANEQGLWLKVEWLGEFERGRREHDLYRRADRLEIVFKVTRSPGFGLIPTARHVVSAVISDWFAVFPATPRQYLDRLVLTNQLYPGLNALEGFCRIDGRFAMVTSQPFIAGRNATEIEIRQFLGPRGFTRLCEATWFRSADGLAIFDVGGSNLFATDTGELVPIDLMPIVARGELLSKLHEALERIR